MSAGATATDLLEEALWAHEQRRREAPRVPLAPTRRKGAIRFLLSKSEVADGQLQAKWPGEGEVKLLRLSFST